jgi:long-chain acyl-CoA synthetase
MNLIAAIAQTLAKHGDTPAFLEGEKALTRKEALAYAAAIAERLEQEDLGEAKHVGMLLPNGLGAVGSIFGAMLAGGVAAPMNPLAPPAEIATLAKIADIKVVLTGGPLIKLVEAAGLKAIDVAAIRPGPQTIAGLPARLGRFVSKNMMGDTAVILFTSGTTGTSKAAMLTHGNLLGQVQSAMAILGTAEGDRMHGVLPYFHSFGITGCLMLPAIAGMAVVLQQRFTPQATMEAITEHKVNYVLLVPAMFAVLMKLIGAKGNVDLSGVKAFVSGGAALPTPLAHAWKATTGAPIYQGYGLTETSPITSIGPLGVERVGSSGKPVSGVEVQIWGEDGQPLPVGEIGEVAVRGHNVMKGYYKNPEATAATIAPGGWLRSGDFGRLDEDGYVHITGRKKELIIVAGENVYPGEVEDVIAGVPGVMEIAVVAGYDDTRGEFVRAIVAPFPGDPETGAPPADKAKLEEAIMAACRANVAAYKVPRRVEFVEKLPRNATGKVLKRELEQRAKA